MTDLTHLVGQTLSYDTAALPFHELFLACGNQCLEIGGTALSDLSELNLHVDEQSVGPLYREFYSVMEREPFLSCYRRLIEDVVAPLFGEPFRFQRKPGIRIHLPNVLTVQFHTDEWYGHGPDVVNFWMPLTAAFDSNTLLVASLADSLREVGRLEAEKATMATINGDLAKIVKPLQSDFGRLHIFNAKCAHGSSPNETGQTRVSIDFRILPDGADPGLKPIDEYYTSLTSIEAAEACGITPAVDYRACSYLFGAHGFTRHISTTNQRLICTEFAKTEGITILAEETEIRTMTHHPTLLALAEGSGSSRFNTLLLFSVYCLPAERADRLRIYHVALERCVTLFFANERLRIDDETDIEQIERHWESLAAAA